MASRWWRSYADTHRNPKIARLSDADFRLWHQLLCVASENDGAIPPAEDLKHVLNKRLDHLSSGLKRLVDGRLISPLNRGYAPTNWDERQYKSDTSTTRVQKFREKRNVSGNVSGTAPDTETDNTLAKANGGKPPADPVKELFDLGVSILTSTGLNEKQARSLIGKYRKEKPDAEVLQALLECRAQAISEPVEWLAKRLKAAKYVSQSGYEYRGSLEQIVREAERRADWGTYWTAKKELQQGKAH
jgi:hypothetical protein